MGEPGIGAQPTELRGIVEERSSDRIDRTVESVAGRTEVPCAAGS